MLRWIGNILCGLSLLLFLALIISWPIARTKPIGVWYKRTEVVPLFNSTFKIPHHYFFTISGNEVAFGDWRSLQVTVAKQVELEFKRDMIRQIQRQIKEAQTRPGNSPADDQLSLADAQRALTDLENRGFSKPDGLHTGPNPIHPWPRPRQTTSFAGLSYQHQNDSSAATVLHRVAIPIWLLVLFFFLAPLFRGISLCGTFRRRRSNLCPSCGYDLRATPALCPECGQVMDAALSR